MLPYGRSCAECGHRTRYCADPALIASRGEALRAEFEVSGSKYQLRETTHGVYRLRAGLARVREFRYGNHPVRQHELVRDYSTAHLEALFESRFYTKKLPKLLNRG